MLSIPQQAEALDAARAFATETSPGVLVVIGPAGVGKTELVRRVCTEVSAQSRRCAAMSAHDLIADLVEAVRRNSVHEIERRFGSEGVVFVEDVSDLYGRPGAQAECGRLIAEWVSAGSRVVCTARGSLQDLVELERRLPRPPMCRVVALRKPTRRDMRDVLQRLAIEASVEMDGHSLNELAAWCDGDIGRAIGAIRQRHFETAYARWSTRR